MIPICTEFLENDIFSEKPCGEFLLRPDKTQFQPKRALSLPDTVLCRSDMSLSRPERLSFGLKRLYVGLTGPSAGPESTSNDLRRLSVWHNKTFSQSGSLSALYEPREEALKEVGLR